MHIHNGLRDIRDRKFMNKLFKIRYFYSKNSIIY